MQCGSGLLHRCSQNQLRLTIEVLDQVPGPDWKGDAQDEEGVAPGGPGMGSLLRGAFPA